MHGCKAKPQTITTLINVTVCSTYRLLPNLKVKNLLVEVIQAAASSSFFLKIHTIFYYFINKEKHIFLSFIKKMTFVLIYKAFLYFCVCLFYKFILNFQLH